MTEILRSFNSEGKSRNFTFIERNAEILGIDPIDFINMGLLIGDYYQWPPKAKMDIFKRIFTNKHRSPNAEANLIIARVNSLSGIANQRLTGGIMDSVYEAATLKELTLDGMYKYFRDYLNRKDVNCTLVNDVVRIRAINLGQLSCLIADSQRASWGEIPLF